MASDRVRLCIAGELDVVTADIFEAALKAACLAARSRLVVDASDLVFCDSSGVRALVRAARSCSAQEIEMLIVGATGAVARVFEIVHGSELFQLVDVEPS